MRYLMALCLAGLTQAAPPTIGGCPVLPADHVFNSRIDDLPVHPRSADFLTRINSGTRRLHLDLGRSEDMQSSEYWGIPYNVVSGDSITWQRVHYDQGWPGESDCADASRQAFSPCSVSAPVLPIPPSPKVEGGIETDPSREGDHHILMVDRDRCVLWESYHSYPRPGGGWDVLSTARFDLHSNRLRPAGWTSADAAGFPILPLLLRADEASLGEIRHALRFTIQSSKIRNSYVWPARHLTRNGDLSETRPPMGQLFRLKADYPIPANYTVQARAILTALKRYGMYLADGGSDMYIQGEPSARWEAATISQVQSVPHTAFEAVDLSSVASRPGFDPDSAALPPPAQHELLARVVSAGSATRLDLGLVLDAASRDQGRSGRLYIAALLPRNGTLLALTASQGWQLVQGLALPAYADVTLGRHQVELIRGADLSAFGPVQVYAGYGDSAEEMLAQGRYRLVYASE
ncbi:hypothetical protein [Chitinimonas lacunae]|uniref:Phosphodiester glycosidase domain-containing protein n=1 Tax=Chitinimonas lacunae TaxID=1963018 RepID=A0ABV8MSH8_9NEIS